MAEESDGIRVSGLGFRLTGLWPRTSTKHIGLFQGNFSLVRWN